MTLLKWINDIVTVTSSPLTASKMPSVSNCVQMQPIKRQPAFRISLNLLLTPTPIFSLCKVGKK